MIDPETDRWLKTSGDDARLLVVEAEISSKDKASRILHQLEKDIEGLVGQPVIVLYSARAVVVTATRTHVQKIIQHPLVKFVRTNRFIK